MKVSVTLLPGALESTDVSDRTVVAIDCFRASTSIVAALAAGAKAVYPFLTVEDARKAAPSIPDAVLAGERGGAKIEGFDLGNSPAEFTNAAVAGRNVVMTTTNGTRLFIAAIKARSVFVGAFVNASVTAEVAAKTGRDIVLAAAGTEGYFSIEDSLCAGMLADKIRRRANVTLDDAAEFALLAYDRAKEDLGRVALRGRGARNVLALGLDGDLKYALAIDSAPTVAKVIREPLRIVKA